MDTHDLKLIQTINDCIRAQFSKGRVTVMLEDYPSENVIRYYENQEFFINFYTAHGNLWILITWSEK